MVGRVFGKTSYSTYEGTMNITKLEEDLRRDEGVRKFPYLCTADKMTIGVGRNLDDVGLSEDEIEYLLRNDIERVINELYNRIDFFDTLSEPRQRALTNMAFQLGINGLMKFKKMWAALEVGHYDRAATEALDSKWARQTPQRAGRIVKVIKTGED